MAYSSPVSLLQAQELARRYAAKGTAPTVYLEAGTYRLSAPLAFDPRDSGPSAGSSTIYRAANDPTTHKIGRVVLLGSRLVTGQWQPVGGGIYKIYVGKASEGAVFRQIYVAGQRGRRARSELMPEGGLVSAGDPEHRARRPNSGADPSGFRLTTPLHFGNPAEIKDVEIVSLAEWASVRCPLDTLSPDGLTITLQQPCWRLALLQPPYRHRPRITWFENALEFVHQPGDWYHDRDSGYLYYYPRSQAELAAGVEIPRVESLITIDGTPAASVRNLVIAGLTFEYSNWTGPERYDGYRTVQSGIISIPCPTCLRTGRIAATLEGAVDIADAEAITIADSQFRDLGGAAIHLAPSTRDIRLIRNDIHDVAGDGIFVGGWRVRPPPSNNKTPYCEDDVITDNSIRSIGLDYPDSAGMFVGICRRIRIEYNTLRDLPQTGISVGWGFSYEPNIGLGGNRIYRNRIENVMQVLIDGGGIYTQSNQIDPIPQSNGEGSPSGTTVEDNYISGVGLGLRMGNAFAVRSNMRTPAVAVYLDHGSSNMTVANNIYDQVQQQPFGLTPPIFGDSDTTFMKNGYQSPCGFRACAIHNSGNHSLDRSSPSDMAAVKNTGARSLAAATYARQ